MLNSSYENIQKLQKSLYETTIKEAESLAANYDSKIVEYEKTFQKEMGAIGFSQTDKQEVSKKIQKSSIVLFGDFHTLKQSQKTFLWTITEAIKKNPFKKPVICLELCQEQDQKHLDRYIAGKMTDKQFKEAVQYEKNWGFFWDNYKIILEFIKFNQLKVYGINHINSYDDNLLNRDTQIAENIKAVIDKNQNSQIICLIGEFHLANSHLPSHIIKQTSYKKKDILRVFHNVDHFHFKNIENHIGSGSEFLKLDENTVCIMNTAPWMKWKSYCIWEEIRSEKNLEVISDEEDDYIVLENEFDITYQVKDTLSLLRSAVGIELKTPEESINCYFNPSLKKLMKIQKSSQKGRADISFLNHSLNQYGHCYFEKEKELIFTHISLNKIIAASGYVLISELINHELNLESMTSRERSLLKMSFSHLCTYLLNPKKSRLYRENLFVKFKKGRLSQQENEKLTVHRIAIAEMFEKIDGQKNISNIIDLNTDEALTLKEFEKLRLLSRLLATSLYELTFKQQRKVQQLREFQKVGNLFDELLNHHYTNLKEAS